jgi:hypothetical protein
MTELSRNGFGISGAQLRGGNCHADGSNSGKAVLSHIEVALSTLWPGAVSRARSKSISACASHHVYEDTNGVCEKSLVGCDYLLQAPEVELGQTDYARGRRYPNLATAGSQSRALSQVARQQPAAVWKHWMIA